MLDLFESSGGEFFISQSEFIDRFEAVKCFLFDWDGVFNDGYHRADHNSLFSEVDSMAINMIRFSYWLSHEGILPKTGIITGQDNEQALFFAKREHLDFVMLGYKNKRLGLEQIKEEHALQDHEIAFVFDDILDLSICEKVGLRLQISRPASPLLNQYVEDHELVDYRSACTDSQHGLREMGELIVAGIGNYEDVIKERASFSSVYQSYWEQRNNIIPSEVVRNH